MTLTIDNRLNGDVGVQVSDVTLAATADTGTVTIANGGTRAVYDDTQTLHGLPSVRLDTGGHRGETPALQVSLPASGPWSARWYVWMPQLQDAGHGTDEVRSSAVLPTHAWTVHGTAGGNVGTRLQTPDLAAAPLVWDSSDGSAVPLGQLLRVEMAYDGTDLVSQVFAGHATTGARINTWLGLSDPGRTLDITGYRWRRRTTLRIGDQGPEVTELQNDLIDLGEDLSPWGADGDFGSGTQSAVMNQQSALGLSLVDGEAGPETRAAMDLALGTIPPPVYLSHLAVADDGVWIGPAAPPPEPSAPAVLRLGSPI
ncbi:peptidoglycan-binding protein [Nocardiopsis sp. EMB25]|uniref:peptidoglycan-binding domain-containing protein n=1 Tax=Nocardiopsis sp. EMB25 TaxID=2835867 RepID=UPI00228450D7|nr:peptidoglycan-binding domain-containing protein [Nocardiopsis sp. EMB25]MCY9786822.1 peptidoglycan-binding protein [Nocardiopsis sp. EMB25]